MVGRFGSYKHLLLLIAFICFSISTNTYYYSYTEIRINSGEHWSLNWPRGLQGLASDITRNMSLYPCVSYQMCQHG